MISVARAGKGKLHIVESKREDNSPELFCGRTLTKPVVWGVDNIDGPDVCQVCYGALGDEQETRMALGKPFFGDETVEEPPVIENTLTGRRRHGQTKANRDRRRQQMKAFLHG